MAFSFVQNLFGMSGRQASKATITTTPMFTPMTAADPTASLPKSPEPSIARLGATPAWTTNPKTGIKEYTGPNYTPIGTPFESRPSGYEGGYTPAPSPLPPIEPYSSGASPKTPEANLDTLAANSTKALERASQQAKFAFMADIAGNITSGLAASDYTKSVKATKIQYENQKKILDLNMTNTANAMMENLLQNMADLDGMMAAKNVDVRSQGVQGLKDRAGIDLNRDIAMMETQTDLNKRALDLDYAMRVREAANAEKYAWQSAAWNTTFSGLKFLGV